ncbi:ribonuclease H-like domain-containing protein [Tanacetum coccineum]
MSETGFQDLNHLNFFDNDYLETPNDDERIESKHASDGSFSLHLGNNVETDGEFFNNDNENSPVHSSDNISASEDVDIATLDENQENFEGNLNQNSNSDAQVVVNPRRSSIPSVFPRNLHDFVVDSKVKYGLERYVNYSKMEALLKNDTWEITELPKDRKAIGNKWVYRIKYKYDSEIERCLLNLVMQSNWFVFQLDGNNAFLYGDLDETVYMKLPEGQFMYSPLASHSKIVFKILRYLKGSPGMGVHITKDSVMSLTAYSDAN